MDITHAKVSAIPDGGDATQVRPSDWNDRHVLVDIASAADLAALTAHVGGGGTTPVPGTILGDDGTGYSEWKDLETLLVSYERRLKTVHARIESADILTCFTSPVVVIPAVASGYGIRVLSVLAIGSNGDEYVLADSVTLYTDGGPGWADVSYALATAGTTVLSSGPWTLQSEAGDMFTGAAIMFGDQVGDPTGGTRQIDLWIDYMVIPEPVP